MTSNFRRAAAVTGLAGAAVAFAGAGTASAMPTDFRCTAGQVDTTIVAGDPGAGQRYVAVVFTAKPGESCNLEGALPVAFAGADGVTVAPDPGAASALVTLSNGRQATMLLHWTGIEDPEWQVRPTSVTITAPGTTTPHGVTSDPRITLPWNQSPLDNAPEAYEVTVGPVVAA
ncbi:DUF4232 domain-containing protein [Amycolatopsis sp. FDAARGOS 1241]|uniref:DUF4232 domain-containing protein n=1 Tax=Amycolatopsis sp. FDAARGOS 1241 TaxID=2778070 RepID=UPI001EF1E7FA|nr:DUF4232 domain-containing protein [Amycolatopsis sp. FDAARGOS 1241]